jgi:hypothetical protein
MKFINICIHFVLDFKFFSIQSKIDLNLTLTLIVLFYKKAIQVKYEFIVFSLLNISFTWILTNI